MSLYLGIDPGASGALCLLDTDTLQVYFKPTPCPEYPAARVLNWITSRDPQIRMIGIEDVHAIQGTSAGSNFKFGYNFGLVCALAEATCIGVDMIKPREWQRTGKLPTRNAAGGPAGLKKAIAAKAQQLYPSAELYGPRGGLLDGRADALMIAHHIAHKYKF